MIITVRDLEAKEYQLDVESSDTIFNIMVKIEDAGGPVIEDQRMIYSGKLLENTKTLEYYGITDETTIHLTPGKKHVKRSMLVTHGITKEQWTLIFDLNDEPCRIDYLIKRFNIETNNDNKIDIFCQGQKLKKQITTEQFSKLFDHGIVVFPRDV